MSQKGRNETDTKGRGKGLEEGRVEMGLKKEQAIRMGEREKLERRDEKVRREGNGERREDKGREEREKGGWERESGIPFSPFKLAQIRLDTLLINRYNKPLYISST